MIKLFKYGIISILILANVVFCQNKAVFEEGTCQNPYIIEDTITSISIDKDNVRSIWFRFECTQEEINIGIFDNNKEVVHYMIFKYTGDDFCENIASKKLISERNKVCDRSIETDAASVHSYENINLGMCGCEQCCYSFTPFKGIVSYTYYLVVYNPKNDINITLDYKHIAEIITPITELEAKRDLYNIDNIQVGQSIVIDNIYFHGGSDKIQRHSYASLDQLFEFLDKNKTVAIEIQGHVNAPNNQLDMNHSNNLGGKRAKAVYDYLIKKGIDSKRLSHKGYGNTQMVFPYAKNEYEMSRNRRVEILIISK